MSGTTTKEGAARLENVAAYLPTETVRYLHGLYLDQPYPYDDPYRYWRW